MDDDIVSLIGLVALVNKSRKSDFWLDDVALSQLSLSLYLITQCQIKLRHSVTSLARTMDYVHVARFVGEQLRKDAVYLCGEEDTCGNEVEQLVLKLVERVIHSHCWNKRE